MTLLAHLPLLLLLLLHPSAAAETRSLYILEGKSAEFRCFYDAKIDLSKSQELALSVQSCSQRQDIVLQAAMVTELAAVLGVRTFSMPAYREVFAPPPEAAGPPVFRLNPRHRLVRDGTVRLEYGNATYIAVSIRAEDGVNSLCATCSQAGDTITYTETSRAVIRIVSPPTARLSVNGEPTTPGRNSVAVNEGEPLLIDCQGYGEGELTARLTKSGRVRVSAFPEAHLSCSSTAGEAASSSADDASGLVTTESYDSVQYYTVFRVTFSNLDRAKKETLVSCQAVNRLGSRELQLKLTALAPTPEIVSDRGTNWWNSYHLRWQHHVKANVDHYRIRVVHLSPSDAVLNETEEKMEKVQTEEDPGTGVSRMNSLVFGLRPDSAHNISLQACNGHGCSDFSGSVRVHTARESADAFNNPENPVFAKPQSDQKPGNAAPSRQTVGKGALVATWGLLGCFLASQIRLPW